MANNIYSWSETANSNTSLDGLTWAEGQTPSSVNNSARQMMASIAAFRDSLSGADVAGGTANAITLTSSVGFTSLANGRVIAFKASNDNTGATTLNVNSLGAKSVRKVTSAGDAALTGAEIQDDCVYFAHYSTDANGGSGGWLLVNPTPPTTLDLVAGSYTPTITAGTNVAAVSAYTCYYTRIGTQVHVWGLVDIDPTSASTNTDFTITLPIASDFSSSSQLSGTAVNRTHGPGSVFADVSNNNAVCNLITGSGTNNATFSFAFDYVVV